MVKKKATNNKKSTTVIETQSEEEIKDRSIVTIEEYLNTDINGYEDDVILSQLDEDTILQNIITQIKHIYVNEEYSSRNSFFEYFYTRYNYLYKKYKDVNDGDNKEIMDEAKASYDKILNKIHNTIQERFNFDVVFDDMIDFKDKIEYIRSEYEFFVLNLPEKMTDFIYAWIIENMDSLCKVYPKLKEKDQTFAYKMAKSECDGDITPILANIKNIIPSIDIDPRSLLNFATLDNGYELNNYMIRKEFLSEDPDIESVTYDMEKFSDYLVKLVSEDIPNVNVMVFSKLVNKFK